MLFDYYLIFVFVFDLFVYHRIKNNAFNKMDIGNDIQKEILILSPTEFIEEKIIDY